MITRTKVHVLKHSVTIEYCGLLTQAEKRDLAINVCMTKECRDIPISKVYFRHITDQEFKRLNG